MTDNSEKTPILETELIAGIGSAHPYLVVVLHGLGDSIAGYRWLPGMVDRSDVNYLLVNAPDAYDIGFSWYDIAGHPEAGVIRSRKLLFNLLDEQIASGYDAERIALFGFSQGCLMAVEVGLRYPHRLAGVVGISGYVFNLQELIRERSDVAGEQRLLITHGRYDPLIPIGPTRRQIEVLKSEGISVSWHEFDKDHTIQGELEMAVIRRFFESVMPPKAGG